MKDDCEVTRGGICKTRGLVCRVFKTVEKETGETVPGEAYAAFLTKLGDTPPKTQFKHGMIGYTNKDGKRYICRISRYLGVHLGLAGNVSEAFICKMADILTAEASKGFVIKVHRGEAIESLYYDGFGSNSCMTGRGHDIAISFYSNNPEKIGLITAECGTQQARALLWKLDNDRFYRDRIYYNTKTARQALRDYTIKHNFLSYDMARSEFSDNEAKFLSVSDLEDSTDRPYFDSMTTIYKRRALYDCVAAVHVAAVHFSASNECERRLLANGYMVEKPLECVRCHYRTDDEDDLVYVDAADGCVCENCLTAEFDYCTLCEEYFYCGDGEEICLNGLDCYVCRWCIETLFHCDCPTHDTGYYPVYWRSDDDLNRLEDGRLYCDDCYMLYCEEQEEQEQEQKTLFESEVNHE
jgi:hypothetical protein